jgi:multiple sugar transport system ATP-binding protein
MNFVSGAEAARHDAATIGVRPEHIGLSRDSGSWKGTVGVAEHLGSDTFLHVATDHGTLTVRVGGEAGVNHGDTVWLTPDPAQIHRFDRQGARI